MDRYNEFAVFYDELMNDFDYEEWGNYIEKIFEKYNIDPRNILEMACGTGSLTYYLARKRYNVIGFDVSSDMLSKAYEKLRPFKNVMLLEQDMVNFEINKKFDSILSICDSINYIIDKDKLYKCFQNVYNHLDNNGVFVFDINSYYKLKEIIGNNTFVEDREDIFYTWQNEFDDIDNVCTFYLTFFKNKGDNLYHRFDEEHMEKAYRVEEIKEILKNIGFAKIDYFDAFSFEPINEKSERINFVAIK
jgi:SAM-dependent methyltransferase